MKQTENKVALYSHESVRVCLSAHVSMSNNCEAVKKHFSASPDGNVLHYCHGNLSLSAFICRNLITWDLLSIHTDRG